MAESALAAGCSVQVYSRWHPGQPPIEERDGYRLIRVPFDWRLAVPGLAVLARRRARRGMAAAAREAATRAAGTREARTGGTTANDTGTGAETMPKASPSPALEPSVSTTGAAASGAPAAGRRPNIVPGILRRVRRSASQVRRRLVMFPLGPLGWAAALESVVEPADIWHGMWAGSLPALERLRSCYGGRTIYDSRDVFMESRDWATLGFPIRQILQGLERRWAQSADQVLTVSASYAAILHQLLEVPVPPVVMNCPPRWTAPEASPDRIREALGLDAGAAVALYQGRLMSDRGIEQAMDAILDVPGAVLALLGFGGWEGRLRAQAAADPYLGKVFVLPAVPPEDLLEWTASADVSVMAIQPTSLNHEWTTPQKLFESLAAGTPVVASDLPGMAEIVTATQTGILVDPTSPAAIASAIRKVIEAPEDARAELRARARAAADEQYNWESQLTTLFAVYRRLLPPDRRPPRDAASRPRRGPAGSRLRFIANGDAALAPRPDADVSAVLDPTWVPAPGDADGGALAVRDVAAAILRERDLGAEAMALLEQWELESRVIERTTIDGTSFWYGMRARYWTWLVDELLWLAVVERILADRPDIVAIECLPGSDARLVEATRLVAERRGLAVLVHPSNPAAADVETGPVAGMRLSVRPRGRIDRLRWRIWPPAPERRRRSMARRLARLAASPQRRLLVLEAHVRQRIDTPTGPRFMNAYLGPIVDRLQGGQFLPVELDLRADPMRPADWQRLTAPSAGRTMAMAAFRGAGRRSDNLAARQRGRELGAEIAADDRPLLVGDIDLGPLLRADVGARVARVLGRRAAELADARALLRRLRPSGLLLADEYHRQEWLAAAAAEGVPVAAVQHGVIHREHLGYIHHRRPPELRVPGRTYVFGRWERDVLVKDSVYRPDEVVVGGSPRLDLVARGSVDAEAIRAGLGIAPAERLVVLSGTWGNFQRRVYYPAALRGLFDRPVPGTHVVVKLHPTEQDDGPYGALIENIAAAAGFEPPPVTTVQMIDLYRLLAAADAHLGIRSTVVSEAVVVGTPNLLAADVAGADPLDYVASGVAIPVRDGGDLVAALESHAGAASEAQRRAFVDAHFDPGGGADRIARDLEAWLLDRERA